MEAILTRKSWYRYFLLLVLVLVYAINTMDRQVLSLLLQDIKVEFLLTDTQLGLLGGIAFAFFYSIMGIPIARKLDAGRKGEIFACCILLWSIATVFCGMAVGFLTLLLARIATAVGEAGGAPASHSLISDYFTPKERVTALSIFALGVPIGSTIGNFTAGWINEFYDWRYAFIAVGIPGVFAAVLVYFLFREECAGHAAGAKAEPAAQPSLFEVWRFLWGLKAYVHMCVAAALHSVVYYAGATWNPSFLMRTHNLGSGETGTLIASFSLVGLIGTFLGGYLANKLANNYDDQRWIMWVPAYSILLMIPFQFFSYLSLEIGTTLLSFWVMLILAATFFGPSYAVCQSLARPDMRAMAAAVYIFVQTLIGLGLGPLLVGMISDYLAPRVGVRSLGYALVLVGLTNLWSVYHYLAGSRVYRANIEFVQGRPSTVPFFPHTRIEESS